MAWKKKPRVGKSLGTAKVAKLSNTAKAASLKIKSPKFGGSTSGSRKKKSMF